MNCAATSDAAVRDESGHDMDVYDNANCQYFYGEYVFGFGRSLILFMKSGSIHCELCIIVNIKCIR